MIEKKDFLSERELEILRLIAEGSSDREIAQNLYLSINTVKWHNRQIYAKLGVKGRGEAVSRSADLGLFEGEGKKKTAKPRVPRNNLPALLSSFVGREREINSVKDLMETQRLVTITGPGGVGKTRLAIQVAEELLCTDKFPDGIFLIELASVTTPERVGGAIQAGLGLISQSGVVVDKQLSTFFSEQKILLVLDNYEHVLEAAPLVGELLAAAPDLIILATSRESLRLSGEQVYPLAPLNLPEKASGVIRADSEAIQLFIQRAVETKPDLVFSDGDIETIGEICARLDGLPLAIELAAARIKFFRLQELLTQLDDRFAALVNAPRDVPERHQSLQRAIDWSYQLLSGEEKILFYRLSVFQGGWTIEAVDHICCQNLSLDVLDGLSSLLDKNMLQQEEGPAEEPRFFMLETLYQYARQQLELNMETQCILHRHACYFVEFSEQDSQPDWDQTQNVRLMERLDAEHENIRIALEWCFDGGDIELGLRLVGALGGFWFLQGHYQDGEEWTERALEFIDCAPARIKANVLVTAGLVYYYLNKMGPSRQMYEEALRIYRRTGDLYKLGETYIAQADTAIGNPAHDEYFREKIQKGLSIHEQVGNQNGIHVAITNLGVHEGITGNFPEARKLYDQALDLARKLGHGMKESVNLINLSVLSLREGDPVAAQKKMNESLSLLKKMGYKGPYLTAGPLAYSACIAVDLGQFEKAVVLFAASDALFTSKGFNPLPESEPFFNKYRNKIQSLVDQDSYHDAWDRGQSMSPEQAVAFVLQ